MTKGPILTNFPYDLDRDEGTLGAPSRRILVVEDDESVREVAVDFLADHGYEISEAEDGEEAIGHLMKARAFDLLFTDVNLPGDMGGLKIAAEAKQLQPNIKVLLTTGYAASIVEDSGSNNPTADVILKPYRQVKLLKMVEALLGRNAPKAQSSDAPKALGPKTSQDD